MTGTHVENGDFAKTTRVEAPSAHLRHHRPVLHLRDLSIAYQLPSGGRNEVVREVDLVLRAGEILGLVGESGCGKSTTALAAVGYRAPAVRIIAGQSMLDGTDLLSLSTRQMRSIWGRRIGYVAQQASTALNPTLRIGQQLAEPLRVHLGLSRAQATDRSLALLDSVGIPSPRRALQRYGFQFSGGQQQRIAIAIALSCDPEVLILDEPTTGLDVTTQARISELLAELVRSRGVAALYVSHDLGLLNSLADRIAVMYGGRVVEMGRTDEVVRSARHPYTRALMAAAPTVRRPTSVIGIPGAPPLTVVTDGCAFAARCPHVADECSVGSVELEERDGHFVRCLRVSVVKATPAVAPRAVVSEPPQSDQPILRATELGCTYPGVPHPAVDNINLRLEPGETLGIVGESGSGKSTLLRVLAGLQPAQQGTVELRGQPVPAAVNKRSAAIRRDIQLIFQDPHSSLNPRHNVRSIVARSVQLFRTDVSRAQVDAAVVEVIEAVGLPTSVLDRYPGELSGGQKQRVAIARAFAAKPAVLLCDEITSALDVSVQATVLTLMRDLCNQTGTSAVFVSHDLAVVRSISARIMVMRSGRICEEGRSSEVFARPSHAYTQTLLQAVRDLPN